MKNNHGTLLRHPVNGTLVYSPFLWNDATYAATYEHGMYQFTLATPEQIALFDSVPTLPGEYVEEIEEAGR